MKNSTVRGLVKRHPDGFGFILPENPEDPDLYVSRKSMKGLMSNDRVEAEAIPEKDGRRFFAKKIKILSRGTKHGVGIVAFPGSGEVSIEGSYEKWGQELTLDIDEGPRVKPGDLVSFEFVQYEDPFVAVLKEVIGDPEDPMNDIQRVLLEKSIPIEFSKKCLEQSETWPPEVDYKPGSGRLDLRDLCFITIDGVTAKDFDDAICVHKEKEGFRLWVAIADVSHYVRPGDAIDGDAIERGTSVYLPNICIPMLPESLSNELCSLKPKVDRFAFVCEMEIGFDGALKKKKVYEAVICSKARVTYGEAQDFLNSEISLATKKVEDNISTAADLSKILMKKRFHEGALNLEVPETEIIVDEQGIPIDLVRSERVFAHKLIEELMLVANVAVAQLINEKEAPGLFRIHEAPDAEDISKVQLFLSQFGGTTRLKGGLLQKKLSKALAEIEGQPQWSILNILILRSMNQAQYSPSNVGHFGLGFPNYSHFTSPIRRYPDLIVHRILKKLYTSSPSGYKYTEDELLSFGTNLSAFEQRAVKAERTVKSIKKARFMEDKVGDIFEGTISSVARFGVFVLLKQFDVDGLVKLDDLGNDYFDFDDENLILRGKKTKISYSLGDTLSVQVAGVNIDEGKIDFVLESSLEVNRDKDRRGRRKKGSFSSSKNREKGKEKKGKNKKGKNAKDKNWKKKKSASKKSESSFKKKKKKKSSSQQGDGKKKSNRKKKSHRGSENLEARPGKKSRGSSKKKKTSSKKASRFSLKTSYRK